MSNKPETLEDVLEKLFFYGQALNHYDCGMDGYVKHEGSRCLVFSGECFACVADYIRKNWERLK